MMKIQKIIKKVRRSASLNSWLCIVLLLTANAGAQETKAAQPAEGKDPKQDARPATKVEEIKNLLGLSIYLQGGYTYNFEDPDSGKNEQRLFDQTANSPRLDLAQIQLAKDPAMGGLGYKLKLSFGETAKYIHSQGLGGGTNSEFDLTEVYVDYLAPLGEGLKLRFGKFATFIGAEVIEARDNYNYSRSFLFNYAEPFTHTGFMAQYPVSKMVTVGLFLINGWDVTNDNNGGKTGGASIAVTPSDSLSFNFNFLYGPEQTSNTSNPRFLFDWVGTFNATKKLTFKANVDYGREVKDPNYRGNDSQWYGVAAYVRYDWNEIF
ncbi:MAG TPA: outer membrane beta-barrel protein, partial [Thermodesulfobacteriota bacterium]|nr:outer membrane beta-barrel protein [Thermodesulfobacteriota bacterium]